MQLDIDSNGKVQDKSKKNNQELDIDSIGKVQDKSNKIIRSEQIQKFLLYI